MRPDNQVFRPWYLLILGAAGHYEELMEEYKKEREKDPHDFSVVAAEFDLLVMQGKRKEAEEEFEKWVELTKGSFTADSMCRLFSFTPVSAPARPN